MPTIEKTRKAPETAIVIQRERLGQAVEVKVSVEDAEEKAA